MTNAAELSQETDEEQIKENAAYGINEKEKLWQS